MSRLVQLFGLLVLCAIAAVPTAMVGAEPIAAATPDGRGASRAGPVIAAPGAPLEVPGLHASWDPADGGEAHQLAQAGGRWVRVSLSRLAAQAMVGNQVVYTAPITAGTPAWPTPTGTFRVLRRVYSETMDSATIGLPRGAPGGYYLPGVLYTQYFTPAGHALHYNYWSPPEAFGRWAGSHGCVGLRLGDAAYFWGFATVGTPVVIGY